MYNFCPLINNFPLDDSRPIILSNEYIQSVEISLLESIHIFKFNHKLCNLIQKPKQENSAVTKL